MSLASNGGAAGGAPTDPSHLTGTLPTAVAVQDGSLSANVPLLSTSNVFTGPVVITPAASAGPPVSGTHSAGEVAIDSVGTLYTCVAPGGTGTWVSDHPYPLAGSLSDALIESVPMLLASANNTVSLGAAVFSYFVPQTTLTIAKLYAAFNTAYSGSPTLTRLCLYTVDASGNLTAVARTTTNLGIGSVAGTTGFSLFTTGSDGFVTSYKLLNGTRYAIGYVCVGGSTGPTLRGVNAASSGLFQISLTLSPPKVMQLNTQTDLPTSVTYSTSVPNGFLYWFGASA